MLDDALDEHDGDPRDTRQHPVSAGRQSAIEVRRVTPEQTRYATLVQQRVSGEVSEFRERLRRSATAIAQVIAHDELEHRLDRLEQLLELQSDHAALLTELDDMPLRAIGDAAQHLAALQGQSDITQRDLVLELAGREHLHDLVESGPVPLQRRHRLVGPVHHRPDLIEHVAHPIEVEADRTHGLRDRDDGEPGLLRCPLRTPMTGPRLVSGDRRVGDELHVRAKDATRFSVDDERAVHLREFRDVLTRGRAVDLEATGAQGHDLRRRAEHDQCTAMGTKDALDPIAHRRPRSEHHQDLAAARLSHRIDHAALPCMGARPAPDVAGPPRRSAA